MKRVIGILIIVFFAGNTFAQNISQSDIPAVVLNSFQLKYPNAEDVSWELDKGNYHVRFEVNHKFNEVYMDYKGTVLKFHKDLWESEVPQNVLKTIKSRVEFFDLNDADLIIEGNNVAYEINFEISGKDQYFWINEKGKLIKYRKELKDNEVPEKILGAINSKYGKFDLDRAKYVEENGSGLYIIRGEINDKDHIFTVDTKAVVIKHEQDLRDEEVPVAVLNAAKEAYNDYEIRDEDLIEEGGNTVYILEMRKSRERVFISFSPDGKILEVK